MKTLVDSMTFRCSTNGLIWADGLVPISLNDEINRLHGGAIQQNLNNTFRHLSIELADPCNLKFAEQACLQYLHQS